jgi:type III pantothenate kinase
MSSQQISLALAIGNSRLHWGWFVGSQMQCAWDTPHLSACVIAELTASQFDFRRFPDAAPMSIRETWYPSPVTLKLASVVPEQARLWQTYPGAQVLTLTQIPLSGLYPTLGVDRALAAWSATQTCGQPVLVIDGGTALTFTGVNDRQHLVGGAILPGLRLQMQSLTQNTAALPAVADWSELPPRWASDTADAIRSGVLYTLLAGIQAFIQSWWQQYPTSAIVFTGGDGAILLNLLQQIAPDLHDRLSIDPYLLLCGIQQLLKDEG